MSEVSDRKADQPPILTAHVVIAGFRQRRGRANGSDLLYRALYARHAGPQSFVGFSCWDDDVASLAELLWRWGGTNGNDLGVGVYAYSWGAPSAMQFAEELRVLGIGVARMVLSDPVYRCWWLPWRPLLRWPKIYVPANVARVDWFRQHIDWPCGHDLVAEDEHVTFIADPIEASRGHGTMDELGIFHMRARAAARSIEQEARGDCA